MGDTMSATKKQVIENGKRVACSTHADGSADDFYVLDKNLYYDFYVLDKNLYCIAYNADGYFADMWCMGYAKKAAKDYGINIAL